MITDRSPDPFATESLGLQLVGDLAGQLGGSVTLDRHGGTTFQVSVPHAMHKEIGP